MRRFTTRRMAGSRSSGRRDAVVRLGHDRRPRPRGAVDQGTCGRSQRSRRRRPRAPRLDDSGTTLGDSGTVVAGQPLFVHQLGRGSAGNLREGDVRSASGYLTTSLMSAFADADLGRAVRDPLRVIVEAHHRGEARVDIRRGVLGDGGVGVRGVTHGGHARHRQRRR